MIWADSLSQQIRWILLHQWDPIGVSGVAEAADEYDAYVAPVRALIEHRASVDEIFAYLWGIEREWMGLTVGDRTKTLEVAERLAKLAKMD